MNIPLNQACLTCGSMDYLEHALVGETLSRETLLDLGMELENGDDVLICFACYLELGQ